MQRLAIALLAVLVALAALLPHAAALFEDEAGQMDWHKALIGTPTHVHFATIEREPRVLVATSRSVVAALDAKKGSIVWRHMLPRGETLLDFAGLKHWGIATLSRAGETLRARFWDPASGNVRWDVSVGSAAVEGETRISFAPAGDVLLSTGTEAILLDRKSGGKIWTATLEAKGRLPSVWQVAGNTLTLVNAMDSKGTTSLAVRQIDLADGKVIKEYDVADVKIDIDHVPLDKLIQIVDVAKESYLVIKPAGHGAALVSHKLGGRDILAQPQAVPPGGPRALNLEGGPLRAGGNVLVRLSDGGLLILNVDAEGKLKPRTQFDQRAKPMIIDARSVDTAENYVCLTYAKPWKATLGFELIDLATDKVTPLNFGHSARATGFPVRTWIDVSAKKDGQATFRLMTVFEDGSVHLFDQSGPVWKREESLAEAADAVFVEFAEEKLLVRDTPERDQSGSMIGVYMHRLRHHVKQLTGLAGAVGPSTGTNETETKQIFRDVFGMRKLLLFLSKGGKLVALESESGSTIWERYIAMEAADAGSIPQTAKVDGRDVLLVRTTAEQYPPIATVVLSATGEGKSFVITHALNAMDGSDFGTPAVTVEASDLESAMLLPVAVGPDNVHPILLVDSKHQVRVVPESAASAPEFADIASKVFFLSAQVGAPGVSGFHVDFAKNIKRSPASETWNLAFPAGEKLATVSVKPTYERIASIGRVRGDRSVLYKYLNPHVVALGTVRQDPPSFSVYVLDTVKGAVLYHAEHAGGSAEGAHIAQAENWIIYSFWNAGVSQVSRSPPVSGGSEGADGIKKKKKRKGRRKAAVSKGEEIVALELYESGTPDTKLAQHSSYQLVRPYVLSQSYTFQTTIDAMGVTTTRSGITTREALVVIPGGQLLGVSRRFLDPRRPLGKPTAEDQEEGLIPYQPLIPFNPRDVASYSLQLLGIQRIKTAPAFLESTSLVLAFGMDVFFTRRMPSKAFDVLSEDFSRISLVATTAALLVGIVVARQMSNRKRVYDAFQS